MSLLLIMIYGSSINKVCKLKVLLEGLQCYTVSTQMKAYDVTKLAAKLKNIYYFVPRFRQLARPYPMF